jgi:hypothetical protein
MLLASSNMQAAMVTLPVACTLRFHCADVTHFLSMSAVSVAGDGLGGAYGLMRLAHNLTLMPDKLRCARARTHGCRS